MSSASSPQELAGKCADAARKIEALSEAIRLHRELNRRIFRDLDAAMGDIENQAKSIVAAADLKPQSDS